MELTDSKLRLKSKRLKSGKFQVNFSTSGCDQECYGYMLAEASTSVTEVIEKIRRHVSAMQNSDRYYQRNLFSLCRKEVNTGRILIFKQ